MSVINVIEPESMDTEELRIFSKSIRGFFQSSAPPERTQKWRENGIVERDYWTEAGAAGLLGVSVPAEYGGGGGDFRHDIVIFREAADQEVSGFNVALHNGVVVPYFVAHGTEEQKKRWLPGLCDGTYISAIAMSEPSTGSDLQNIKTVAVKSGNQYRLSGAKTFISSGQLANLIVVAAKTDPSAGAKGVSLFVVETEKAEGFRRGRKLKKLGQDAADTSELFFDDVMLPAENLLGGVEGLGFIQLMKELPRERLVIAAASMQAIEKALDITVTYTRDRKVFGKSILDFQNTQFRLADLVAEATMAKTFVNYCIEQLYKGQLDPTTAAMAKLQLTELQGRVVDQCLQFHGGYGYMEEFQISRMYRDARITRIFGGSNEIMRMLIARTFSGR